jgi:predicted TIM-barrel fold metal-dependent hydrolase
MSLMLDPRYSRLDGGWPSRRVTWGDGASALRQVDHLGRPNIPRGLDQPAFAALLRVARTGRVTVKMSGYAKFSKTSYPFEDCWPFVGAVVDAFSLDHCVWASDWPFLRATERQDYGPLLALVGQLFPNAADRRKLFWDTPIRLFNFAR